MSSKRERKERKTPLIHFRDISNQMLQLNCSFLCFVLSKNSLQNAEKSMSVERNFIYIVCNSDCFDGKLSSFMVTIL